MSFTLAGKSRTDYFRDKQIAVIFVRYADDMVVGFQHADDARRFLLMRKTGRDRMRARLRALKIELRRRMDRPIREQGYLEPND